MDWKKAKTILIAVLLLTNLLILYAISTSDKDVNRGSDLPFDEAVDELLKNNNIEVDPLLIPEDYSRKMPALRMKYDTAEYGEAEKAIANAFEAVKPGSDAGTYKEVSEAVLKEYELYTDGVEYVGSFERSGEIVLSFGYRYKGTEIENCVMEISIKDGKMTGFSRSWAEPQGESGGKQNVISPASALLRMIGRADTKEICKVEALELVYYTDPLEKGNDALTDTSFPAWKITYNGGKKIYISAFAQ